MDQNSFDLWVVAGAQSSTGVLAESSLESDPLYATKRLFAKIATV